MSTIGKNLMRSGNPALNNRVFRDSAVRGDRMTLEGTVNKTGFLLVLLMLSGAWSWQACLPDGIGGVVQMPTWVLPLGIGTMILAFVGIFKKTWTPWIAPIYAVLEGAVLGAISVMFETQYPGIVGQAVFLTFGVLGALLMAYRSGLIKATENFKLGVVAATGGIFLVYIVSFVMGFFGMSIPLIHSSGPMGIAFSLFVVAIASLNLVLDFDFIENGAQQGAPKYMEWYGAFGLLITLVWLYLEILRLLSKIQSRD